MADTVTGLLALLLFLELWAASHAYQRLFERSNECPYVEHYEKKDVQRMVKDGREMMDMDMGMGMNSFVSNQEKDTGCTVALSQVNGTAT